MTEKIDCVYIDMLKGKESYTNRIEKDWRMKIGETHDYNLYKENIR